MEECLKLAYVLEWQERSTEELKVELDRISEISLREPIQDTHPALYVKFMALGDMWKARIDSNYEGKGADSYTSAYRSRNKLMRKHSKRGN